MSPVRSTSERIRLIAALAALAALGFAVTQWFAPSAKEIGREPAMARTPSRSGTPAAAAATPDALVARRADAVTRHPRDPKHATVTRPLPAAGAPLADVYAELKARADAGEAAAASRLYRKVQRCAVTQRTERALANLTRYLPPSVSDAGVMDNGARGPEVRMLSDLRELVDRNGPRCTGATKAQLDSLVPVMFRAAQLGDVRAISCYGASGFESMPGLFDHPEWLADMRDNIASMYDYALRHGDWVVVELLHQAYAGIFVQTPAAQAIRPDASLAYRYLRLERLGASGAFVQKLERLLAVEMNGLSRQQIADGDAWANDTYAHYFAGTSSNEVSNGANICRDPED